jgi:hypothetical protein
MKLHRKSFMLATAAVRLIEQQECETGNILTTVHVLACRLKRRWKRYLENLEICIGLWGDVSGSAGPSDSSDTREHFQLAANFHTNASPMISNLKRNFNLCKLKTSTHSMQ